MMKVLIIEQTNSLVAQHIISHCAHSHRMKAVLACMMGKIGRCTTQLGTCREHVEEYLTQSHYIPVFQILCIHSCFPCLLILYYYSLEILFMSPCPYSLCVFLRQI